MKGGKPVICNLKEKRKMRRIIICILMLCLAGCEPCFGTVSKQQICLYRPDHAYHANDLLRAVFTPVLDTDDNLWQGMLFSRRLQAYDTISYLIAMATGRIYSADIQTMDTGFVRSGWSGASQFPSGVPYTYVSYNDNTGTADTLQVTIPQGYGRNAKIKILCTGGPASGIVKITIDGAETLVNGDDT